MLTVGVFAVGDVRSGSSKRVATAVSEGAAVVSAIHEYLAASRPSLAGRHRGAGVVAAPPP